MQCHRLHSWNIVRGREWEREKRKRERGRERYFTPTSLYFCRITCETGMKTGSIITDTISVTFKHVQGNIESDESFDFVVSLLANLLTQIPREYIRTGIEVIKKC